MTGDNLFYQNLKTLKRLQEVSDLSKYTDLPEDWWLVLTDVRGSTAAIENGKYKDVNIVAASTVAAILNLGQDYQTPFIFGGDGTTSIVPAELLEKAQKALFHAQRLSLTQFNLDIRVAFIPAKDLYDEGLDLKIAKLKISEKYKQAIFAGNGFDRAEFYLKDKEITKYDLKPTPEMIAEADYSGLTCRWQDIKSPKQETLALIVKATSKNESKNGKIYARVIQKLEDVYGMDMDYSPIRFENINLSLSPNKLSLETRIQTFQQGFLKYSFYLWSIVVINFWGKFLNLFGLTFNGYDPKKNRETTLITSDYKKFDGSLKMIIAGDKAQRDEFMEYLNNLYKKGDVVYGIHVTDRALITCLVAQKTDQEVHFIDAADGGYALAAKVLKKQLRERATE